MAICPLCGKAIEGTILEVKQFSIGECVECQLGLTIPASLVSEPSYEEAPQYATAYQHDERFRIYARNLLAHVRKYVDRGRLLDVGCSVGLLVDEASRAGYLAEGIDLDTNAIDYGKEHGRKVSVGAVEESNGRYDVICLAHTLEHIPKPVEFLAACVKRLNANGCIVVQVPCMKGLHPRIFREHWYGWVPRQHYCHYSATALRRLLEMSGLDVLDIWQESMDHRPPIGMRRRDRPRAIVSQWIAQIGNILGLGDQLVGIGRVRKHQ
ncbi:MAG: class I SAM-dependent methyltransferase [Pirellula sp.]